MIHWLTKVCNLTTYDTAVIENICFVENDRKQGNVKSHSNHGQTIWSARTITSNWRFRCWQNLHDMEICRRWVSWRFKDVYNRYVFLNNLGAVHNYHHFHFITHMSSSTGGLKIDDIPYDILCSRYWLQDEKCPSIKQTCPYTIMVSICHDNSFATINGFNQSENWHKRTIGVF